MTRRLGYGLSSQVLSSLSNFALVVAVARTSAPEAFGAFAIAYSGLLLLVNVVRAAIGETLAVTANRNGGAEVGPALGAGTWAAVAAGMTVTLAGVLWPSALVGRWLLLFGPATTAVLMQDVIRSAAFAVHRPQIATASDAIWVAVQAAGWLTLGVIDAVSAEAFVFVWAMGALLGAIGVMPLTGAAHLGSARDWVARHRRLAGSFGLEAFLFAGATQATVYAVGFAVGLPAAGALRGAQSLFGPIRSAAAGFNAVALPEAVLRRTASAASLLKYLARLSLGMSAAAVGATIILSCLPETIGVRLLGATWPMAEEVVPAVGLSLVAGMAMVGPRLGLRTLQATSAILRLRGVASLLSFGLGVGGGLLGGLLAAAYGLAVAQSLTAALGWWYLLRQPILGSQGSDR